MSRKIPDHLKLISGTTRPDRAQAEPALLGAILEQSPAPPDWLPTAHAVKEWERLAPLLVAGRRLTEAMMSPLGHLCALHGKIVQLWAAGETPTGHLLAQYNKLIDSFGIPPMAAGKLKPVDESGKTNKFRKFKGEQSD